MKTRKELMIAWIEKNKAMSIKHGGRPLTSEEVMACRDMAEWWLNVIDEDRKERINKVPN